jgi:hypothetical protein
VRPQKSQVVEARNSHRLWARTPGPLSRSARGPGLSPYHPSHPASSSLTREKHKRRKPLYPAHWAWNVKEPFALIQTDAKDILDKGALETRRWQHIRTQHLPRYQWTACDGRTRLHFLAYSHHLNRTNGVAFMVLVLLWLRAHGVGASVTVQTDWGEEFGGDNQEQIQKLGARFLAPLHGTLCRYPMCRKGYHGRVERSHRTDDEEFYHPYLLQIGDTPSFLSWAARWAYFYNVLCPHFGNDMGRRTPLAMLKELGYHGREHIAVLPPILLDAVSTDLLMACDAENGNDLLAFYRTGFAVVTRNR